MTHKEKDELIAELRDEIAELKAQKASLKKKADQYDYEQYWSTGGRQNHGAG